MFRKSEIRKAVITVAGYCEAHQECERCKLDCSELKKGTKPFQWTNCLLEDKELQGEKVKYGELQKAIHVIQETCAFYHKKDCKGCSLDCSMLRSGISPCFWLFREPVSETGEGWNQ